MDKDTEAAIGSIATPSKNEGTEPKAVMPVEVVGSNHAGVGSPRKKQRSEAWDHFTVTKDNMAKCNLCGKQYSYCHSTTILVAHLKKKHNKAITESSDASNTPIRSAQKRGRGAGIDIMTAISNYMVQDLMSPDLVNGVGFQRLVLNIENPCSMPSKRMLVDDIIPSLYAQAKQGIIASLSCVSAMALSIEEWTNSRNVSYVSIAAHYSDVAVKTTCKMLETFPIDANWSEEIWGRVLTNVFEEWHINPDAVTAVVCSCDSTAMVSYLERMGYPCIPCLHYLIKESVREVFNEPMLYGLVTKVRKQVIMLKMNPIYRKLYQSALTEMVTPLYMDDDSLWMSTLEMLSVAVKWKATMQNVLFDVPEDVLLSEDEWTVLEEVISVLVSLKMAAMSATEQKSYLSLIRPLLHQLISNQLADSDEDSDLVRNLKSPIRQMLQNKYTSDGRVAAILDTATYIDPRFKCMPNFSESQKSELGESVYSQIKDIVVHCVDLEESQSSVVSNTQMLLGNFLHQEDDAKVNMAATARLEYQTYVAHPNVRLEFDPLEWWAKQSEKYPRLCHLAQKYLCVPSITTLPGKSSLEQLSNFASKRSLLDADTVDTMLFLHVNAS